MGLKNYSEGMPLPGEMKQKRMPYTVGALLYAPATNNKIVRFILQQKCDEPYSASLCLEDSISDSAVHNAEIKIVSDFQEIRTALEQRPDMYLPNLFIRVRRPDQIPDLYNRLGINAELLTGFIAPKYSLSCADEYNRSIALVNEKAAKPVYLMPTLESDDIVRLSGRHDILQQVREKIDSVSDWILNVRVGGNDFCNAFGVRRNADQTIYDILPVSGILSDILTVFTPDYVVSGPVWEYFSGEDDSWKTGLEQELKLDRLSGFIGKTVIHPMQIPVVNESLRVSQRDLADAQSILCWTPEGADPAASLEMVRKNQSGERMNEVKVHTRWAEKISILARHYGVKE